jgi:hypothetical protein
LDAGVCCCAAFHGLEIDAEVENQHEEACAEETGEGKGAGYVAVLEEPWGKRAFVAEPDLCVDEDYEEEGEADEEADDARVGPGVGCSAPLEGED